MSGARQPAAEPVECSWPIALMRLRGWARAIKRYDKFADTLGVRKGVTPWP